MQTQNEKKYFITNYHNDAQLRFAKVILLDLYIYIPTTICYTNDKKMNILYTMIKNLHNMTIDTCTTCRSHFYRGDTLTK